MKNKRNKKSKRPRFKDYYIVALIIAILLFCGTLYTSYKLGSIMNKTNYNYSDEELKDRVEAQLAWNPKVNANEIDITVDEKLVTLKGRVGSFREKVAAYQTVSDIAGIRRVVNDINVIENKDLKITDSQIQLDINNILELNTYIDTDDIFVYVNNGEVILEGTVDSYWKRDRVEEISDIRGVRNIDNKITIVQTGEKEDEYLAREIVDALDRNLYTSPDEISVEVRDSNVTLKGKVSNMKAYTAAEMIAWYTTGVSEVQNDIEIK